MAVAVAWKRLDYGGRYKTVIMKMTYAGGDTTVACDTGLSRIVSYNVSVPSVDTKVVTGGTVSAGTVTLTVTDPLAACYLYLTAYGI